MYRDMPLSCCTVTLNSGAEMPIVGLGTFRIKNKDIFSTLETALNAGYRSFDTASVYGNESSIASSLIFLLPKFGLSRKDIFITSKLGPKDMGSTCRKAVNQSLDNFMCDYIDLYLIHWPAKQGLNSDHPDHRTLRCQTWKELECLHTAGKLKSIGVSNYTEKHLNELFQYCSIKPAVLQSEYHPHLIQNDLKKICYLNTIHFQAYSSLGTSGSNKLLGDPTIIDMAGKYGKSTAQILLRWSVQQGVGVIPKATDSRHLLENIQLFDFDISTNDMEIIHGLNEDKHYCWDPTHVY